MKFHSQFKPTSCVYIYIYIFLLFFIFLITLLCTESYVPFVQMNLEYLTIDTQVCLSLGGLVVCTNVGPVLS